MTKVGQLFALMRKNYMLQRRRPLGIVIQLLLPALFYFAFGLIRILLLEPETNPAVLSNPWSDLPMIPPYMFSKKLAYIPSNNVEVQGIINDVILYGCKQECVGNQDPSCLSQCQQKLEAQTIAFAKSSDLTSYLKDTPDSIWAAVVFVDEKGNELQGSIPEAVRYQLRLDGSSLPFNDVQFQEVEIGPTDSGEDYIVSGFVSLQVAVDQALLWHFSGVAKEINLLPRAREFPYPKHTTNEFYTAVKDSLAFYTCLSFVYFVLRLVNQIVTEKELKIKEAMKIMGLNDSIYWASWFIFSFAIMSIAMLLVSIVAKVMGVYDKSSFILILFLYEVWGVSLIAFCFLISTFFSKAKVAGSVGVIVLFVALIPNIAVDIESSGGEQFAACLSTPACLSLGVEYFSTQEEKGVGVQWDNINDGEFSYTGIIWTMILDTFLYFFLSWYLDEVLPREYGVQRKWYFIFDPQYWRFKTPYDLKSVIPKSYAAVNDVEEHDENTEPVSAEIAPKISVNIRNLRKDFEMNTKGHTTIKTAVNNLNLRMYQDQITALLGHNGAGKTTTMAMLTGFLTPTSGDAVIYGQSILSNIESIRENIGYCPQYNVLWDDLTVEEHIRLFAALKGVPKSEVEKHVRDRIHEVGLDEKTNSYSKTLSGGQKRKLCVAIAFTGGTKLIFLDEPTSGMDPFSRRAVWDLLQNLKTGRTIVLTTHFMDEADLLGDRIAIMSGGMLAACGSSLFLKSRYGIGYSLTMVKNVGCQEDVVTNFLKRFNQGIAVMSNVGAELSYVLPQSSVGVFGSLFEGLETHKDQLQIDGYGLSVTTLEEVFLRLADRVDAEKHHRTQSMAQGTSIPMERIMEGRAVPNKLYDGDITYERSYWHQFIALLMKRFLVSWRDSKALFQIIFYPTIFVLLAVVISNSIESERNTTTLKLSYSELENFNRCLYADNTSIPLAGATVLRNAAPIPDYNVKLVSSPPSKVNEFLLANRDVRVASVFDSINATSASYKFTSMYDTTAFHSLPIGINYVNNAVIRTVSQRNIYIKAESVPLPILDFSGSDYARSFNLALYVGIAVCIIPGALVSSVVKEREVKATHQQIVSGAKPILLWITYLISDMVLYMMFCIIIFIIFAASGTEAYTGNNFFATAAVLFTFGLSAFPFTYILSLIIKKPSAVQTKVTTWFIIYAMASLIIISILYSTESTNEGAEYVDYIFTSLPPYAVSIGIFYISINDIAEDVPGQVKRDPLDWEIAGRPSVFMLIEFVVFSLALYLYEKGFFDRVLDPHEHTEVPDPDVETNIDSDVLAEQKRIEDMNDATDAVVVKNLRKVYVNDITTKVAVKKLSFGIPEGECFGLLGPNGAGKTTTLSILSGDYKPTGGDVWLRGTSIRGKRKDIFKVISLCPQFDPLLDLMTGREHLRMYGRLRGVPEDKLDIIVENAINIFDLDQHADKLTQAYSGGNKRKLSLAIAMLGDPKILFLDEPSTGMDPLARRFMWNTIAAFVEGRSIILTTHSMEECEALCTRIGIMVNGRMKCLGSAQHLKTKFGRGYRLELQTSSAMAEQVKSFIQQTFPESHLVEWHGGKLRYQISAHGMNLATAFNSIETNRARLSIEDYALSQTTLEQVFVSFAQQQEAEAPQAGGN
eukprot:TRINITY_DN2339_c0_g1_i1.p1 TRINITY_DN2339_c0_g1~~TRINITY_DN2339_c0_g1_i1.p1  ORF type:complete len:1630 (+),score=380.69 TRINITY_DN2339_c0_g1_i1:63-4952(+)